MARAEIQSWDNVKQMGESGVDINTNMTMAISNENALPDEI